MAESDEDHALELCSVCWSIKIRQPFYGPEFSRISSGLSYRVLYRHHEDVETLETCVDNTGCHLCTLIHHTIRRFHDEEEEKDDDWINADDFADEDEESPDTFSSEELALREKCGSFFQAAEVQLDDIDDVENPILLDITVRPPKPDEPATRCADVGVHWTGVDGTTRHHHNGGFSMALNLDRGLQDLYKHHWHLDDVDTSGPYATALARYWLNDCELNHELCHERKKQTLGTLPTRVVHVGNDDRQPYLYISRNAEQGEYVCLSHCWGKGERFMTEEATLSARIAGFDISSVPKTFHNAIRTTRSLGMQYLWIDSLCIIQDSKEDWEREAAQMGKIYRDASITIFAQAADSDDGGCFMSRQAKATAPCRTPMFDGIAGCRSMPKQHHVFDTVRKLENRPTPLVHALNQRGWTLQETLLSFRALMYDELEVRWSCPTVRACECIPEGNTRRTISPWDTGSEATRPQKPPDATDPEAIDTLELSQAWYRTIEEFSHRNLTFSKDKLPAVAGMASELSRHTNGTYHAGLWQESLRSDLSWHVPPLTLTSVRPSNTRPSTYRAPSWSWASISGPIQTCPLSKPPGVQSTIDLSARAQELLCSIVSISTLPANPANPFGEVFAGCLVLRGRMRRARCRPAITTIHYASRIAIEDEHISKELGWFDPDVSSDAGKYKNVYCAPIHSLGDAWRCLALVPASPSAKARLLEFYAGRGEEVQGEVMERVGLISPRWNMLGAWTEGFEGRRQGKVVEEGNVWEMKNGLLSWVEVAEEMVVTVV